LYSDAENTAMITALGVMGGVMVIACVVAMIWYKKKFKAPETVNSYENGGPPVDNDEKLETCEMQVKI